MAYVSILKELDKMIPGQERRGRPSIRPNDLDRYYRLTPSNLDVVQIQSKVSQLIQSTEYRGLVSRESLPRAMKRNWLGVVELKKQSSCSIQLTNNTTYHVAFKESDPPSPPAPHHKEKESNLYHFYHCIKPVTMQAQKVAPADMACKDKFLIQSTVVPVGTTSEDITSSLFVKDNDKYVEENKLKVALISPTSSPDVSPINGDLKNGLAYENDQIFSRQEILSPEPMRNMFSVSFLTESFLSRDCQIIQNAEQRMVNEELKHEKNIELIPEQEVGLKTVKDVAEELEPEISELEVSKDVKLNTVKDVEELKTEKEAEVNALKGVEELKLMEAIEEMKFKLDKLESKLDEARVTISKLTEERRQSNLETKILQEKLLSVSSLDTVHTIDARHCVHAAPNVLDFF
ncbi:vesicle-associated protein 2-2-like isoform X1 [Senna tora]|uniref:Vesicle-associated protein 2-2-like isoform X1 n=1 Tax=Senna tora TaxID=362788 RepID=A0A834TA51_9FABA|nr:vesicle-associated protein 2-2-like isoform X1 [Senna tora]